MDATDLDICLNFGSLNTSDIEIIRKVLKVCEFFEWEMSEYLKDKGLISYKVFTSSTSYNSHTSKTRIMINMYDKLADAGVIK